MTLNHAIRRGDVRDLAENVGKQFVLPSSFVGGPRYMVNNVRRLWLSARVKDILIFSSPSHVILNGQRLRVLWSPMVYVPRIGRDKTNP